MLPQKLSQILRLRNAISCVFRTTFSVNRCLIEGYSGYGKQDKTSRRLQAKGETPPDGQNNGKNRPKRET